MPTRSAVQHNDHGESRYVLNGNNFWVRLLADQRGYCFVGSNSAGNNAYFVRKDRVGDLPQPGLPGGYVESRFRESRDVEGKLSYLSGPDRLKAIQDKKLFDVTAEKTRLIRDIYEL